MDSGSDEQKKKERKIGQKTRLHGLHLPDYLILRCRSSAYKLGEIIKSIDEPDCSTMQKSYDMVEQATAKGFRQGSILVYSRIWEKVTR